jgi:hypothetical protein
MIERPASKDMSFSPRRTSPRRTHLLAIVMRVALLSIAAVFFMGGCFSPTFDEEVTLASLTKPKLKYLHTVSTSRISLPTSQMFYLPVPAATMGGFLGVRIDGYPKLYYLKSNSLKGPIEGGDPIPTLPGLEYVNGLVFGNFTSSPLLTLYFPSLSNLSGSVSDLLLFSYDVNAASLQGPVTEKKALSDLVFTLYFSTNVPGVPVSDLYLLGLQLRASSSAAEIYLDTFVLQKSNKRCYELSFRMDSSVTVQFDKNLILDRTGNRTYFEFSPSPFSDSKMVRYFYSPDSKKSYAQVYEDGNYRTYYWDEAGVLKEMSLEGRIATVLSSNDILCVKEKYGLVYSPEGRRRFKFALGSLSVIYELIVNGVPTLFFVESIDQRDEGGQLFYETYTLPTAELSKLEE